MQGSHGSVVAVAQAADISPGCYSSTRERLPLLALHWRCLSRVLVRVEVIQLSEHNTMPNMILSGNILIGVGRVKPQKTVYNNRHQGEINYHNYDVLVDARHAQCDPGLKSDILCEFYLGKQGLTETPDELFSF